MTNCTPARLRGRAPPPTIDVGGQESHHGPRLTGFDVEHHLRGERDSALTPRPSQCYSGFCFGRHLCSEAAARGYRSCYHTNQKNSNLFIPNGVNDLLAEIMQTMEPPARRRRSGTVQPGGLRQAVLPHTVMDLPEPRSFYTGCSGLSGAKMKVRCHFPPQLPHTGDSPRNSSPQNTVPSPTARVNSERQIFRPLPRPLSQTLGMEPTLFVITRSPVILIYWLKPQDQKRLTLGNQTDRKHTLSRKLSHPGSDGQLENGGPCFRCLLHTPPPRPLQMLTLPFGTFCVCTCTGWSHSGPLHEARR